MAKRKQRRKPAPRPPRYGEGVPAPPPAAEPEPDRNAAMKRGYARAEERNQRIRDGLEPLEPGERPGAVTVAAVVALVLAVLNGVAVVTGTNIGGDDARPAGIGLSLVILVAAIGMWKAKYWAVLGFQALLTLQLIIAFLALLVVDEWWRAIVFATILGLGGWLFWKLVRAMARLQMPVR